MVLKIQTDSNGSVTVNKLQAALLKPDSRPLLSPDRRLLPSWNLTVRPLSPLSQITEQHLTDVLDWNVFPIFCCDDLFCFSSRFPQGCSLRGHWECRSNSKSVGVPLIWTSKDWTITSNYPLLQSSLPLSLSLSSRLLSSPESHPHLRLHLPPWLFTYRALWSNNYCPSM